jgi:hypothetical protein
MIALRLTMNRDDVVKVDWSTNPANQQEPMLFRALTKVYYNVIHAKLLFWPSRLSADYACMSVPVIEHAADPRNAESAILLSVLIATAVYCVLPSATATSSFWKRLTLLCFTLTVVPFLPSCGLFLEVGYVVAERLLCVHNPVRTCILPLATYTTPFEPAFCHLQRMLAAAAPTPS